MDLHINVIALKKKSKKGKGKDAAPDLAFGGAYSDAYGDVWAPHHPFRSWTYCCISAYNRKIICSSTDSLFSIANNLETTSRSVVVMCVFYSCADILGMAMQLVGTRNIQKVIVIMNLLRSCSIAISHYDSHGVYFFIVLSCQKRMMNMSTLMLTAKIAWLILRYGVFPIMMYQPTIALLIGLIMFHWHGKADVSYLHIRGWM